MSAATEQAESLEFPGIRPMPREVDAWTLVSRQGFIPINALIPALRRTAKLEPERDYRTRMMVHDALDALAGRLGAAEVQRRLSDDESGRSLLEDWAQTFDKEGFWSIKLRLMEPTTPDVIRRMLRDLGQQVRKPTTISVGGSCSLILSETLLRQTEDIDVVDELPEAIRTDHELVNRLAARYNLRPTHFASHYLPNNWSNRTRYIGTFNKLSVRIVDPIDVLTGKMFSKRDKDFNDVQACWPQLDAEVLRDRLRFNTQDLRAEDRLRGAAEHNWYVLTGEDSLP